MEWPGRWGGHAGGGIRWYLRAQVGHQGRQGWPSAGIVIRARQALDAKEAAGTWGDGNAGVVALVMPFPIVLMVWRVVVVDLSVFGTTFHNHADHTFVMMVWPQRHCQEQNG